MMVNSLCIFKRHVRQTRIVKYTNTRTRDNQTDDRQLPLSFQGIRKCIYIFKAYVNVYTHTHAQHTHTHAHSTLHYAPGVEGAAITGQRA